MDDEPLELEFSSQPAQKRGRGRPRKQPVPTSVPVVASNIPTGAQINHEIPSQNDGNSQVQAPAEVKKPAETPEVIPVPVVAPKKKPEQKPGINVARRRG